MSSRSYEETNGETEHLYYLTIVEIRMFKPVDNFISDYLSQSDDMPGSKISDVLRMEWQFCSSFYTFGVIGRNEPKEHCMKVGESKVGKFL